MSDAVKIPAFPYFGGTDNPGDNTAIAGGGVRVETGGVTSQALAPTFPLHAGSDTTIIGAIPPSGGDTDSNTRSADPGGMFSRVAGQDETIGELETSGGVSPSAFPEPNP
jgi:hypothetical protein